MNHAKFNTYDAKYTCFGDERKKELSQFSNITAVGSNNNQVPPIAKRASAVSKSALLHLLSCERTVEPDYSIFISKYGELPFIERNNEDNADKAELSPTSFSHSVHNTLACLHSIFTDSKSPSVSLSVNESMIQIGTLEAISFLNANPQKNHCLIIIYDSHVPDRYVGFTRETPVNFALSFIVSRDESGSLDATSVTSAFNKSKNFTDELNQLNTLCDRSQHSYRAIQRIYDKKLPVNSEYLTEYYF